MLQFYMMLGMIVMFSGIQISLFKAFPMGIKKYLAYTPILAVSMNFFGSWVVLSFAGVTNMVGPANMMASVIFAGYVVAFKKYRNIHKVKRGFLKFPGLEMAEGPHWFF